MKKQKKRSFLSYKDCFSPFFSIFDEKMAKQTLVFESPKELSLKGGMMVIADREKEETTFR